MRFFYFNLERDLIKFIYGIKWDGEKLRIKGRIIIEIILAIIVFFCFGKVLLKQMDYKDAKEAYKEVEEIMFNKDIENKKDFQKKYDEMKEINNDYIFWIKVDGTNINYPVVKSLDNDDYLFKDFKGNKSSSGAIFLDYKSRLEDFNLILHGHNMKNETMFNNLIKFKEEEFYKKNKRIEIITNNERKIYEIFSVYVTDIEDNYLRRDYNASYIAYIKNKSLFENSLEINEKSKMITLSTCSYEYENARTVVHAVRIE